MGPMMEKYTLDNYKKDTSLWEFKTGPSWYTEEPRDPFIVTKMKTFRALDTISLMNSPRHWDLKKEIEYTIKFGRNYRKFIIPGEEKEKYDYISLAYEAIKQHDLLEDVEVLVSEDLLLEDSLKMEIIRRAGRETSKSSESHYRGALELKSKVRERNRQLATLGFELLEGMPLEEKQKIMKLQNIYAINMYIPGIDLIITPEYFKDTFYRLMSEYQDDFEREGKTFYVNLRAVVV